MARKAVTIEDRVREFCITAQAEDIMELRDLLNHALLFRFGAEPKEATPAPARRTRKPKAQAAAAAKLPGVE